MVADLGGGWGEVQQKMAYEDSKHDMSFVGAAGFQVGFLQFKLGMIRFDTKDIRDTPTGEAANYQTFNLYSVNLGIKFFSWLVIEGGYGPATFNTYRRQNYGNQTEGQASWAKGGGWIAGINLVPIRFSKFNVGIFGRYFEAIGTSYETKPYGVETWTILNENAIAKGWLAGVIFTVGYNQN